MKFRFIALLLLLSLNSCKVFFPHYLFRAEDDYQYFELTKTLEEEHIFGYGDVFSFQIYSREGFGLVDILGGAASSTGATGIGARGGVEFSVMKDGFVELPIIGNTYIEGLTKSQLEKLLEEKYSRLINNPYVVIELLNKRVIYFAGGGAASIIALPYEKTTLLEVISLAGGVNPAAKAYKIRLVRGDWDNPRIKIIDLSTLSGLKDADIEVKSNDIIIVEGTTKVIPPLLKEIGPILSLITTLTTIYLLTVNLSR